MASPTHVTIAIFSAVSILVTTLAAPSGFEHGRGQTTNGTGLASARLMKELMEIYKSDSYKEGVFKVQLVNDNLHQWDVKLAFPNPELELHKDMARLREQGKPDYVQLHITFPQNYPSEPPFVRVAYPAMQGSPTGSICMFLLSPQGWLPDCTMEALLLSIIDHQVNYKHRVDFKADRARQSGYTEERARQEHRASVKDHSWAKPRAKDEPWYKGDDFS